MTKLASSVQDGSAQDGSNAHPAGTEAERMPGQWDMWVLVMIEALTFSSYFVVYTIYYRRNAEAFLQSQSQLDLAVGVINTLILLASSWSVARCVERSRRGDYGAATFNLALTAFGGVLFAGLKLHEWWVEIGKGHFFSNDEFFSYYYFLTGMHLLHVLVGLIALGVVYYQLRSPARRSQEIIETGATFWHMVDFLWVIIFALLYIMR